MVRQHHHRHVRLSGAVVGLVILCSVVLADAHAGDASLAASGMPKPLTSQPGDIQRGMQVALDTERGNCSVCHRLPVAGIPVAAFGDLGPSLEAVGARLTPAQLRLRIVDARLLNPDTVMPPYHVVTGLHRVQSRYAGRPALTAQEVEDLVAYLATLR